MVLPYSSLLINEYQSNFRRIETMKCVTQTWIWTGEPGKLVQTKIGLNQMDTKDFHPHLSLSLYTDLSFFADWDNLQDLGKIKWMVAIWWNIAMFRGSKNTKAIWTGKFPHQMSKNVDYKRYFLFYQNIHRVRYRIQLFGCYHINLLISIEIKSILEIICCDTL